MLIQDASQSHLVADSNPVRGLMKVIGSLCPIQMSKAGEDSPLPASFTCDLSTYLYPSVQHLDKDIKTASQEKHDLACCMRVEGLCQDE